MNNIGIVRKIDELGRIVLPKELRKTMNIHSGDDFKISVLEDKIVLEKYSQIDNFEKTIEQIINGFCSITNYKIYIIKNNEINNERINSFITNKIIERKIYYSNKPEKNKITESIEIDGRIYILPIIYNSDLICSILIVSNDDINKVSTIGSIINKIIINILLSQ